MRVTVHLVRMYGSQSQYGDPPRLDPLGRPIEMVDYPLSGYRSLIHLGSPPEWVLEADRRRLALGRVGLRRMMGHIEDHNASTDDLIRQELEGDTSPHRALENNWCITFIVEHETEVPDEQIDPSAPLWMEWDAAQTLGDRLIQFAGQHIDLLAALVEAELQRIYLERVVLDDRIFFSAPELECFGLPRFSSSAQLSLQAALTSADWNALEQRVQGARRIRTDRKNRLLRLIRTAASRLRYAQDRERPEDRMVDLMIAAEALFLHGIEPPGQTESMSFRLATRAGLLLGTDRDQCISIRDHWARASRVRNAILHGEIRDVSEELHGESLDSFAQSTEQHLRNAFRLVIDRDLAGPLLSEDGLIFG